MPVWQMAVPPSGFMHRSLFWMTLPSVPGAVRVDALVVVADDVAIGWIRAADDVVVRAVVEVDAVGAARGQRVVAVEAHPVADDRVARGS